MIAERLKKVRSFIGLFQSKDCNRLIADIVGVGVEFPQETDLMETRVAINNTYLTSRFRIRHRQALGGFGRFDPK